MCRRDAHEDHRRVDKFLEMAEPMRCLLRQGYLDIGVGNLCLHYVDMQLYDLDLSKFIRDRPSEGYQEEVIWTMITQITSACVFLKSNDMLDFNLNPETSGPRTICMSNC